MSLAISDLSMSMCLTREQFDRQYLYLEMYGNNVPPPNVFLDGDLALDLWKSYEDHREVFSLRDLIGYIHGACNNL